jgi:hypothetical protein
MMTGSSPMDDRERPDAGAGLQAQALAFGRVADEHGRRPVDDARGVARVWMWSM